MNDEGLADVKAANPFRLPRLHPGIGESTSRTGMANVLAATMGYSTGYADVDAVLAKLLAGVRGTLGAAARRRVSRRFARDRRFRGAQQRYRRPRSDGRRALRRGRRRARNDARAARARTSKWAQELEVSYISPRALRRFDPDNNSHPCIQRGSDQLLTEEHDRAWVIHRHVVREHGVALVGPDPRTLIDPVDAGDLRDAVVSLLHGWWTPASTCRRWLDNPFYRSYAVLTICRMRYTLQYGVVVSKPSAARWAQAALDARWTPLIQAALAWSSDIVPDHGETLRFIDDTRQVSER